MSFGSNSACLNTRSQYLVPKDVRNTIREHRQDPALGLHSLLSSAESHCLAYKPQNWSIDDAMN